MPCQAHLVREQWGRGKGWPFWPKWPSGRTPGHQSRASTPGDMPLASLLVSQTATSITSAPRLCHSLQTTIFGSAFEPPHPLSTPAKSTHTILCFENPSTAPNCPQCKLLQVDSKSWPLPTSVAPHALCSSSLLALACFPFLSHKLPPPWGLRTRCSRYPALSSSAPTCLTPSPHCPPWGPPLPSHCESSTIR